MKPQLITLPLTDTIHGFLGYGYWEKRPIPKHIAEIIYQHLHNETICHIQFDDEDTLQPLDEPILWDISHWAASTERWKKHAAHSEKEREQREVMNHNIRLVAPFISSFLGIEDKEKCMAKAYEILKGNKIKQLRLIGFTGTLAKTYKDME